MIPRVPPLVQNTAVDPPADVGAAACEHKHAHCTCRRHHSAVKLKGQANIKDPVAYFSFFL